MNKQELDLYLDPVLQAHFETVKEEWQVGDTYQIGRMQMVIGEQFEADSMNEHRTKWYWLPKPIDTENPERGLWGMITGRFSLTNSPVIIGSKVGINYTVTINLYTTEQKIFYSTEAPTVALLMALREQIGGK
jgi:hypothetical protein